MRVGLLAVLGVLALVSAAGAGVRSAATARRTPAVYGYPYAARCPGAGIADVVDRFGMYACNCTSYVAWALARNRQRTDWFVRGAMDAWNWPNVARRAGLLVDRRPAPGAVAVWPKLAPPYGHVAYVTGVRADGRIDVAEYNLPDFDGSETYAFDVRTAVSVRGATFIHVPRTQLTARRRAGPLP